MVKGSLEISNKGLRLAYLSGKTVIFCYEDGRRVFVTFTSAAAAGKFFRYNQFTNTSNPEAFFADNVVEVMYLEPSQ